MINLVVLVFGQVCRVLNVAFWNLGGNGGQQDLQGLEGEPRERTIDGGVRTTRFGLVGLDQADDAVAQQQADRQLFGRLSEEARGL